jgi:hypothetical protein
VCFSVPDLFEMRDASKDSTVLGEGSSTVPERHIHNPFVLGIDLTVCAERGRVVYIYTYNYSNPFNINQPLLILCNVHTSLCSGTSLFDTIQ